MLLRHDLDVIHVEKKVYDNMIGTLLDIDGKTKDNINAHRDLEEIRIQGYTSSVTRDDGKIILPVACHPCLLGRRICPTRFYVT